MAHDTQDVLQRIDREKEDYLDELKDFLRIPSISTDPAYRDDVLRAADFLVDQLKDAGLSAERVETEGYPLVYAEWMGAKGKPTVLFYGHYDVQPVDPLNLWRNDPFEPTIENGDELVARGATDDKGQSFAHVKAVAAMLAERGNLPVNVKFLIEGEEESGGEAIDAYVRKDAGKRLAADCVVVSDSAMFAPGQPSLIYGLKGLCYMQINIKGPGCDLHSGAFGGAVANPLNALGHIIAQLQDRETGRIQIPGFYDPVKPFEDWERKEFASLPWDEDAYKKETGVEGELWGEQGYTPRERAWGRPTCDVNGMWGGYQGAGAKTVLPAEGSAKVSMRLVPDQDPAVVARQFTDYVLSVSPPGTRVEVEDLHGAHPVLIDTEGPLAEAALSAMEDIWGNRPVRVREGGSIPIVSTFQQVLEVPVLLLGFGLNDDRLHSPNEKFNISNFYGGIRSVARILDKMSEV